MNFLDLVCELDTKVRFGSGYNTIFNRKCKTMDIGFIKNVLNYRLIDKLEVCVDTPNIIEELAELLTAHQNIECNITGNGFSYRNGEISYDYGNEIAQKILEVFPCKSINVTYKSLEEAREDFVNIEKYSNDYFEFNMQDEIIKMTSKELKRILIKINQIRKIASEKSDNENYVKEVKREIDGTNLTEQGIKNLIKISVVYNWFATNFTYDNISCAYLDLELTKATSATSKKFAIYTKRLESSRRNLNPYEQITFKAVENNFNDTNNLCQDLKERSEKASTLKCILEQKAICCGTAKAMQTVLESLDINEKYIVSQEDELDISHAYVIAEVEKGKWIKLDPTWDLGRSHWDWFGFVVNGNSLASTYHTPCEGAYSDFINEGDEFVSLTKRMIRVLQRINNSPKNLPRKMLEALAKT